MSIWVVDEAGRKSRAEGEWLFVSLTAECALNFPIYVLEWRRQLHSSNQWWWHPRNNMKSFQNERMWKIIANAFHLHLIDCWRISNCKYTSQPGTRGGRDVLCLCLTDLRRQLCLSLSLSWWENRKLDGRCSRWGGGMVWYGMNEWMPEHEHQYSGNLESLTILVAFVFVTETDDMWSELQVANPNRLLLPSSLPPHWTDLHMHILCNMKL